MKKVRQTPAPQPDCTYPQGFEGLMAPIKRRQDPFFLVEGDLPAADVDFAPLKDSIIPRSETWEGRDPFLTDYKGNVLWLRQFFKGKPELCHFMGCLVMITRRDNVPPEVLALWFRLWDEEAAFLTEHLDIRWKISALRTFGAYGRSELERRLGREFFLATGLMKLADTERSFSGYGPDEPFPLGRRKTGPVSLGQASYTVARGDLDAHILLQLHETVEALSATDEGRGASVLGADVLARINACPKTVFRRLMVLREKFQRNRAEADSADDS
ncbi:hypothetical protein [Celeribacter sp.]|uniref:hypothetical protein n=1 Tax=Celeribacter sp. TaxID=1890673 RepID=UPI003A9407F0